ncbi:MAG: formylglycine-generating enzyme family protein, partial [Myxococcales bacterium]|nr:formylglycine-generating enzyme family protein [Myxococcales bacterium]
EPGRFDREGPQHEVELTRGFFVAATPVTQGQYRVLMGANPSCFAGDDQRPVEQVPWHDAIAFCNALSAAEGLKPAYDANHELDAEADGYRLPTEAEWEYAARAGTTEATYAGSMVILGDNNAPVLDGIAWYGGNSGVDEGGINSSGWPEKQYDHQRAATHPVGQKLPNRWGLYDMLGNVYEWVFDLYGDYPQGAQVDPVFADGLGDRIGRGGDYGVLARLLRSALRVPFPPNTTNPDLGLRPLRTAPMDP